LAGRWSRPAPRPLLEETPITTLASPVANKPSQAGNQPPGSDAARPEGGSVKRPSGPVSGGQRVFTAGHSFHVFVAPLLADLARSAGITGHVNLGAQFLGGSRVLEHWDRPDSLNEARRALRTGRVAVLTLSPAFHPDAGIDRFARLALEHNPNARVSVQVSWVPFDGLLAGQLGLGKSGRDALTGDELRQLHAPYFASVDEEVQALNRGYGKSVLAVVPVGQALIALRERVRAGRAPGLRSQEELFTDPLGHPAAPVQALAAYGHFAVIYRRSPVGLPLPQVLAQGGKRGAAVELNRLLQELAWEAAVRHPLSGVSEDSLSLVRA
jgi:hypothetical protein